MSVFLTFHPSAPSNVADAGFLGVTLSFCLSVLLDDADSVSVVGPSPHPAGLLTCSVSISTRWSSVVSTNPESRLSDDWCLWVSFAGVAATSSGGLVELDTVSGD